MHLFENYSEYNYFELNLNGLTELVQFIYLKLIQTILVFKNSRKVIFIKVIVKNYSRKSKLKIYIQIPLFFFSKYPLSFIYNILILISLVNNLK